MARIEYYKKKAYPTTWLIIGFLFAVAIVISSVILLLYPFASKEKVAYFKGDFPILYQGKQAGNARMEDNTLYVPLSFMKQVDQAILFDEESQSIIITTSDKVVQMPTDSLTYFVNEQPVNLEIPALKAKDGEHYISLEAILSFYPIRYQLLPETDGIWVQQSGQVIQYAGVTKTETNEEKLRLRERHDLKAAYTAQTKPEEKVIIEKESGNYYYVRKENGIAGFIQKEFINKLDSEKIEVKHDVKKGTFRELKGPLHLTWEAVYTRNPDTNKIPDMQGVNVVSPTWFKLGAADGSVKNLGSTEYVNWAKQKGYQIWALFSNDFNPDLTHAAFTDFKTRQNIIRQLLHYSQIYQLDGINIDIENVRKEDGPLVTQFVREATPYFHEAGLYVSMDITFISGSGNWSAFYERDKLAEIVDYLVVMAYDEHWASSQVSGSVASLPWVERNLQKLLEVVPNEKLVLGVPLYTRLWTEKINADGSITVTSKSMSMNEVKEWLATKGLTPFYDDATGQNYVEFFSSEDNAIYKIWLEDELSLKKRVELSQKYQLAGIASWSRYFAAPQAWTALQFPDSPTVAKE